MKTYYLVIGLSDTRVVNDAWLSSDGVNKEQSYYVVGTHLGTYTSLEDAIKHAADTEDCELGIEIKTVYSKTELS